MNAQLQSYTITDLRQRVCEKEAALSAAQQVVDERVRILREAKRECAADACDFNKARVQERQEEVTEAITSRNSIKDELRKGREAVRLFCFKGKSFTSRGKMVRI